MPWVRGLIFTVLVPGVVAYYVPATIRGARPLQAGTWTLGWILVSLGVIIYAACLFGFLAARGTPMIFFAQPLRFLVGEEPAGLVQGGLYRYSRNPMYLGVLLLIFGQAVLFASQQLALYGAAVWLTFHAVVVLLEEPHLRAKQGSTYEDYRRRVPRWFGIGM